LNDEHRWHRSGTAQPFIKPSDVKNSFVFMPPLAKQRQIAKVLDRADALRAMRRKAVDLLDTLVPALYRATFARPAGDGWPVLAMGQVIAESKIGLVRAADLLGEDMPVRYIRMNAITSKGSLNLTGVSRAAASADESYNYGLRPGDLLFNTRNTRELVGKTAIYLGSRHAHVYNNNLMRIRFTSEVVVDYVHQYLRSNAGRGELDARKSGTTSVFAIYAKDLATIPVPVPPVGLQAEFAERVGRIERLKAVLLGQADELDVLFASLKSRAFSGEL
jgi:type I restriction enzyme S subunit